MAESPRQEQQHDGQSLKEQIIQKIRQQEEMQRETSAPRTTTIAEDEARPGNPGFSFFAPNARQMAAYARQLATLVDVGIPLLRSLQILSERSGSVKLRRVSADLARRIEEGQPLSVAMMSHQDVFSPLFIGIVSSGEAGGILDDALRRVADILERRSALRRRVVASLMYPAFALTIMIIALFVMAFFVVPRLAKAYPSPDMLPRPTLILVSVANWLQANWVVVLLLVIALIVLIPFLFKLRPVRRVWDRMILYLPGIGGISRKINVARFTRTLGGLTSAGVPLIDALSITARTSDNTAVERTLLRVRSSVETGGKIDEQMRRDPRVFEPVVVDMVSVGDEAGALDSMLLKIADTYDMEVDSTLRMVSSIVEPLLIVILVIIAGFMAAAVFLPYLKLVSSPRLTESY